MVKLLIVNLIISFNKIRFCFNISQMLTVTLLQLLKPIVAGSFLRNDFSLIYGTHYNDPSPVLNFGCLDVDPILLNKLIRIRMHFIFIMICIIRSLFQASNAYLKMLINNDFDTQNAQAVFSMVFDAFHRPNFGLYFLKDVVPGDRINVKPLETV